MQNDKVPGLNNTERSVNLVRDPVWTRIDGNEENQVS